MVALYKETGLLKMTYVVLLVHVIGLHDQSHSGDVELNIWCNESMYEFNFFSYEHQGGAFHLKYSHMKVKAST